MYTSSLYMSGSTGSPFRGDIKSVDSISNKVSTAPGALNEKNPEKTAPKEKSGFDTLQASRTAIPFLIGMFLLWKYS